MSYFRVFFWEISSFIFRLRCQLIFSGKRNMIFLDNTRKIIFQRSFFLEKPSFQDIWKRKIWFFVQCWSTFTDIKSISSLDLWNSFLLTIILLNFSVFSLIFYTKQRTKDYLFFKAFLTFFASRYFFWYFFTLCFFSSNMLWYLFFPYSLFLFFSSSDKLLYLSLASSLNLSLLFLQ